MRVVVLLTMHEDPAFAREALRAGAVGYVLKEAADGEPVEAVRRAASGECFSTRASPPHWRPPRSNRRAHPTTSPRARSRSCGSSRSATRTRRLPASSTCRFETVEAHRARIGENLLLSSRAELVRYALDRRLLEHRD